MALQTKVMEYAGPRSYTLRLTLTEESTDITTNQSLISYKLEIISGGWAYSQFNTGWNVSINGTSVSYKDRSASPRIDTAVSANGSCTVTSGQTYVTHDSDGTKTIAASASVDLAGSPGPGPMSIASQNWTLTAIPRESQLTVANGTLGTSQNITITPYVATYKHTLAYTCGTASGTIGTGLTGSTSGFTKAWTPPLTLAAQNTSGTSVSVTVTLTTYAADGTTQIGVTSATVNMAMPESIKPSVTVATSNPEGHLATYGGYIQNKSTCQITLTTTTSQGAAISAYSIKVGTKLSYTTNGVTTGVLPEAGDSIPIVVTVTDTRGRTGTATVNIKVLAYSPPAISSVSMIRTNSSGTAQDTGAYATITFSATVTALGNHNTATYKAKYKTSAAASYSTSTLSAYANNYSVSNGKFTFTAAISTSYMAYIEVTDAFGAVDSVIVRVQSSAAFFKADADNNAFTFGKLETKANTFMVAWNTEIDGTLKLGTSIADVASDLLKNVIFHGTCNTDGGTAAKVATVTGTFPSTLSVGTTVMITFTNINSGAVGSLTLNVNETGAKPIQYNNNSALGNLSSAGQIRANVPYMFVYDGTNWVITGLNYNNTYSSMSQTEADTGTATSARSITAVVLDTKIKNTVGDYIVEQGTSGDWVYRKWNSGIAECWASVSKTITSWAAWEQLYEGSPSFYLNYPSGLFVAIPVLNCSAYGASVGTCGVELYSSHSTTRTPMIYPLRPASAGSSTVDFYLHAIGRWKT